MESNYIGNLPCPFCVITPLKSVVPAGTRLHNFMQPVVRTKRFKKYLYVPFISYLVSETVKLRLDFVKSFLS